MKKFVFVAIMVLPVMVVLAMSCAPKAAPPAAAPTQNVTGILKDVNVPAEPGKDVVTIETPQGLQTFTVTENTTFTLEGGACPLEDIGKVVEAGNVTYNCTAIFDAYYNLLELAVWQVVK